MERSKRLTPMVASVLNHLQNTVTWEIFASKTFVGKIFVLSNFRRNDYTYENLTRARYAVGIFRMFNFCSLRRVQ